MPGNVALLQRVARAWVEHQIEGLAKALQLAHDLGAVGNQHIVICHAMHEEQRSIEFLEVRQN